MAAGLTEPPYTNDILRLAAGQEHHGKLADPDASVERRSRTCGSTIALDLATADHRVADIAVRVEACAYGQAAATLMTRHSRGKTREEVDAAIAALKHWLVGSSEDPGDWPEIDRLAPARPRTGRHGAILLPFEALSEALGETIDGR